MAITILNNLYPPLIASSYMPAFIYNQTCRIYFSLSQFNSESDVNMAAVQLTAKHLRSNRNALNSGYVSGIKLCTMTEDKTSETDSLYYVELKSSDIQDGFSLNEYYQVQLRLTAADVTPPTGTGLDSWLNKKQEYFSEWSTVVLIYGISQPTLNLRRYTLNQDNTNQSSSLQGIVAGTLVPTVSSDKETLKSYRIYLKDYNDESILYEDSGWLYPNDYTAKNQLFYTLKYDTIKNKKYKVVIDIETKNGYTDSFWFNYVWQPIPEAAFDVDHSVDADNENGGLRVTIGSKDVEQGESYETKFWFDTEKGVTKGRVNGKAACLVIGTADSGNANRASFSPFENVKYISTKQKLILTNFGNPTYDFTKGVQLTIRRASSKDNFLSWEVLTSLEITEDYVIRLIWDDYTVEPGVWYKYKVYRVDRLGDFSAEFETDKNMVYTDHIFLTTEKEQLKVCFDPQVNNFQIKTTESVVETIGSRYPFVRRQGNIYYKTFGISGTISYLSDIDINLFNSSKDQLYSNSQITKLYDDYNAEHGIGIYNDYVREREFRKKVMDFLYNNNAKLFRSLTEGNILVKLSNISLTPNNTLGRMIYSFSCTAYEIGEPTADNLNKYNVVRQRKYEIKK